MHKNNQNNQGPGGNQHLVGAPRGNRNATTTGKHTKEIKEERKQFSLLVKSLLIGNSQGSSLNVNPACNATLNKETVMKKLMHQVLINVDSCLFETELGFIISRQISGSETKRFEVRIIDGRANDFSQLLSNEALRLKVLEPQAESIIDGVDLGEGYKLRETAFTYKAEALPQLQLLLDSALQHREQYPFITTVAHSDYVKQAVTTNCEGFSV